eukprot:1159442-Pelagomonas_calceolata.AAC.4
MRRLYMTRDGECQTLTKMTKPKHAIQFSNPSNRGFGGRLISRGWTGCLQKGETQAWKDGQQCAGSALVCLLLTVLLVGGTP